MQLRYHQATFDMLTKTSLDPAPFLKELAEYESQFFLVPERRLWTTFSLYQRKPEVSDTALRLLDAFENKHGVRLPESMREWYSLDIGFPLLHVDGAWWPVELEGLGDYEVSGPHIRLIDHDVLIFISEQQAGDWCIKLNEGNNPPVYWIKGCSIYEVYPPLLDGNPEPYPFEIELQQDTPCFSDFIYCFLRDWLASYRSNYGFRIYWHSVLPHLQLESEYQIALKPLADRFQEIPQQLFHWHRFFSATQHFSIQSSPNDPNKGCAGRFYADSADSLLDLIHTLWGSNPPLRRMNTYDPRSQQVVESLKLNPQ